MNPIVSHTKKEVKPFCGILAPTIELQSNLRTHQTNPNGGTVYETTHQALSSQDMNEYLLNPEEDQRGMPHGIQHRMLE